jgi:hypothetical protein
MLRNSFSVEKLAPSGREVLYLQLRPGRVTVYAYRVRDAIAVLAGDARESAIVAQLVPAAEIH